MTILEIITANADAEIDRQWAHLVQMRVDYEEITEEQGIEILKRTVKE